jgi:PAS domain S-box-containing protein
MTARVPRRLGGPVMGVTAELIPQLDAVGDWGLLTTDVNTVVTGWNGWLEQQAGRAASTVVGRPLFEVFPELVSRRLDRFYQQAIEGKTGVLSQRLHRYVLLFPSPKGHSRFDCMQQSGRIIPIVDDGAVTGTLTVIEDVTERVAAEAELREQVLALRGTDRQKDEFLAMLAHELRNPLAPIRNAVHVLRHVGAGSPKVVWCGDVIARQTEQLTRLVDDLLDVSRVSSGKVALHRQTVDVASVVRQAIESNRPLIEERRHDLKVTLPDDPVTMEGDYARLVQVVSNLVNNATSTPTRAGPSRSPSAARAGRGTPDPRR